MANDPNESNSAPPAKTTAKGQPTGSTHRYVEPRESETVKEMRDRAIFVLLSLVGVLGGYTLLLIALAVAVKLNSN